MGITFTVDGKKVDSPPEGLGQKVQLSPEVEAALIGFVEENKTNPQYQQFIADEKKLNQMYDAEQSDISPARARLLKLKRNSGPRVVKVTIADEDWFILRLNWPEIVRYSMMRNRDARGVLKAGIDATQDVTKCVLQCCVVRGEKDETPYFDPAPYVKSGTKMSSEPEYTTEAEEFVLEPAAAELVGMLFDKATDINPDLLPGKASKADNREPEPEPDFLASGGGNSTLTTAPSFTSAGNETEVRQETADSSSDTEQATSEPLNN